MRYYKVKHKKVSVVVLNAFCMRNLKITRKLPRYLKYYFKVMSSFDVCIFHTSDPYSSDPPVHTQQRAKNSLLGPVTQVEEDVDRIQTLLKETFYFNYFIDNLISYFTLVFTFICMYISPSYDVPLF